MRAIMIAVASRSPATSRRPTIASQSMTPTAKTSARPSTPLPEICSGAMYAALPFKMPAWVWATAIDDFATPKSTSFTWPS